MTLALFAQAVLTVVRRHLAGAAPRETRKRGASSRRRRAARRAADGAVWRPSASSAAPSRGAGPARRPPIAASGPLAELIPLTVPEVRRLRWGVVWRAFPSVEQVLAWSAWRRHHQAVAQRCHYRRRGVLLS